MINVVFRLVCEARGEPPPDVFWTRESKSKIIVTDKNSGKRNQGKTWRITRPSMYISSGHTWTNRTDEHRLAFLELLTELNLHLWGILLCLIKIASQPHRGRFLDCVVKYSINQNVLCSFVSICPGEASNKSPVQATRFNVVVETHSYISS